VLDDVRRLADELRRDLPRIDVLANNAGGIFADRKVTIDGHEKTMQVNHLAPFLLTNLLMDVLIESSASVINTSSVAHRIYAKLDIDDIEVTRGYTPQVAYGNAKLENILFTKELNRRFHDQGISTAAFHPGGVASNFASEAKGAMRFAYHTPLRRVFFITPAKGADTLVWLASSVPDRDWKSGEYYYKRKIKETTDRAADAALAARLWEQSASLCGL
jgi:NAD(P)-dependent dehydrogenase (short-subunit alcohol dehydrogenase family)